MGTMTKWERFVEDAGELGQKLQEATNYVRAVDEFNLMFFGQDEAEPVLSYWSDEEGRTVSLRVPASLARDMLRDVERYATGCLTAHELSLRELANEYSEVF